MDLTLSSELKDGYVLVTVTGLYQSGRAKTLFREWLIQAGELGVTRVLCDITRMTGFSPEEVSATGRFDISAHMASALPADLRLAILETKEQIMPDNFTENVMVNRGAHVKITTSMDEAVAWLKAIG